MLMNLDKRTWQEGLTLTDYPTHFGNNHKTLLHVLDLIKAYNKVIADFVTHHVLVFGRRREDDAGTISY